MFEGIWLLGASIEQCLLTMRLFWWHQLPLLLLIQILQPSRTSQKLFAEASLASKSMLDSPPQSNDRIGRYPCLRQRAYRDCYELKPLSVVALFHEIHPPPQTKILDLSPSDTSLFASQISIKLHKNPYKSRNRRIAATVDGDSDVPTLTPLQASHVKKPRKQRVAAIVGGIVASLLVLIIVVLVYICLMRIKRFTRRRSETASSLPSPPIELEGAHASPFAGAGSPYYIQNLKRLTLLELEHATSNFIQSNIIGEDGFGFVYKGLLEDGSIVAIKRHLHTLTRDFFHEVKRLARVHHKHLVRLIGYCEDSLQQSLVFEYLPNGNVCNHLYDCEGLPIGKLNMQHRLSIALGAAKGLEHIHSLVPPLLHLNFRTSKVLVDENFTPKVSDYGLSTLLIEGNCAGSSTAIDCFLDPEVKLSKNFSERSDVYSFGVFLLELISGHEALSRNQSNSLQNLVLQAKDINDLPSFIEKTIGDHEKRAAELMLELALACLDISSRRPVMTSVVHALERIQERDLRHLHSDFEEEIGVVTLGSELFK